MTAAPPVSAVAGLIQLAIAPVFLVAGIGAILNVLANRLARVVDRVRTLERGLPGFAPDERGRARTELRTLSRRMRLVNWAITCCTASALFVCLVVADLFVTALIDLGSGRPIAALFVLAMALLIAGLLLFLLEIRLAARSLRVREELLED